MWCGAHLFNVQSGKQNNKTKQCGAHLFNVQSGKQNNKTKQCGAHLFNVQSGKQKQQNKAMWSTSLTLHVNWIASYVTCRPDCQHIPCTNSRINGI